MTEAEWVAGDDHQAMLMWAERTCWSERKSCLLACACYREVGAALTTDQRDALRVTERYIDGRASAVALSNALRKCHWTPGGRFASPHPSSASEAFGALLAARQFASLYQGDIDPRLRVRSLRQAAMIRDVFGNPFRPVAFAPAWRSGTAIRLARVMYESREFSAMPILADALQDTGCEDADVLDHCRGSGVHVRGCWVLDAVLGKA